MIGLWICLGVIGLLIVLVLLITAYFFNVAICSDKKIGDICDFAPAKNTAWYKNYDYIMSGINFLKAHDQQEIVSVVSYDGLELKGRLYLTSDNPRDFIIFFHGWRSTGFNDGAVIVRYYLEQGYNVLLVDQRARGMSQGKYTCFGIKERYDCVKWASYIVERFGSQNTRIVLEGLSMGASTVMMASALDLPANVVGLLLDCGFTSPYEQFKHIILNSLHMPLFPLMNIFGLYCRVFAGFDIRKCDTRECLGKCRLPVAFIHGGADNFVPTIMSEQNYDAAKGEKAMLIVPEAGHGVSFLKDKQAVLTFLDDFLNKRFK